MIILLNGPLGIGKSTLAEALTERIDGCVMLDGDALIAVHPAPDDKFEHLHATLALLVAHHRQFGYRHFVIDHLWAASARVRTRRRAWRAVRRFGRPGGSGGRDLRATRPPVIAPVAVPYRRTQVGRLVLGIVAASVLFTVGVLHRAGAPAGAWASLVVLGVLSVLFGSLTVEVDREQLRFWFGPGFLRRTVPLKEIMASRVVTNRWWYGWGIRRIPGGWMYNISGLKAVELTRSVPCSGCCSGRSSIFPREGAHPVTRRSSSR